MSAARSHPAAATKPLLEVRDLAVFFPARNGGGVVNAVEDVSLEIAAGQTLGLVGQSGSGKTTTGRAILQLQKASAGTVELLGHDLTGLSGARLRRMRRHMQFVQQNPYASLHPRMTVGEILAEPLRVHRSVPSASLRARVAELLDLVQLEPAMAERYPHEFSGGQRQRIVIARALAVSPDLVVCDEPVSALDVRTQAEIVALLRGLQQKLGLSYLFIAHDLAIVREMANRVAVMFRGRIVEMGASAAVYDAPAHPYTRWLLSAVPVPDPALQRRRLAALAPEPVFVRDPDRDGICPCGERHSETGTRAWHEVGPDHGISCHYWTTGAAAPF